MVARPCPGNHPFGDVRRRRRGPGAGRRPATRRRPRRAAPRSWRRPAGLGSSKARPVMNKDTVNPMPATAPTPTTWAQPAPAGRRPRPRRTASQLNSGDADQLADHEADGHADEDGRRRGERIGASAAMPALASAKTGTMTKLVHGCSASISRSHADTEPRIAAAVARTSSARRSARCSRTSTTSSASSSVWQRAGRREQTRVTTPAIGRVHARLVHGQPQRGAEDDEDRGVHDVEAVDHDEHGRRSAAASPSIAEVDAVAVEHAR